MFYIAIMPHHWGPAHDGEPGRWGVIGPRVGEITCSPAPGRHGVPGGLLRTRSLEAGSNCMGRKRNIHERGLTETKWADQPIGVSAATRYTSDSNLSRINVRSSAHAVPHFRGS
jgi:hypothetical protein